MWVYSWATRPYSQSSWSSSSLNPVGPVANTWIMLRGSTLANPLALSVSSTRTIRVLASGRWASAGASVRCARSATTASRRATSSSGAW